MLRRFPSCRISSFSTLLRRAFRASSVLNHNVVVCNFYESSLSSESGEDPDELSETEDEEEGSASDIEY